MNSEASTSVLRKSNIRLAANLKWTDRQRQSDFIQRQQQKKLVTRVPRQPSQPSN